VLGIEEHQRRAAVRQRLHQGERVATLRDIQSIANTIKHGFTVYFRAEPDMPVHAMATSASEFDIICGYTAVVPRLQRSTADADCVAADGGEISDGGFDDDEILIMVIVV
jgi:hypothetical protein